MCYVQYQLFLHAAIMCPDLPDPDNGDITFVTDVTATFDVLTTATYSCDPGFGLNGGTAVRTCNGDSTSPIGDWSGTAPTCERMFMI